MNGRYISVVNSCAVTIVNSKHLNFNLAVNKLIVGGKVNYVFSLPLNKINFQSISKLVDKEYDECCSSLGIPLRPLDKKMYTYRTRNLRVLILGIIKYSLPLIAVILLTTILILLSKIFLS